MKKALFLLSIILLPLIATITWFNLPKLTPCYTQLTKPRVELNLNNLQPKAQTEGYLISINLKTIQ
jgi:hypothetical protein